MQRPLASLPWQWKETMFEVAMHPPEFSGEDGAKTGGDHNP